MNSLIPWRRTENRTNPNGYAMAPVSHMRWDWDRLFDRLLDDAWTPSLRSPGMPVDLAETDETIRIRAEVPGIDPSDLDVSLTGDLLTLSAEKTDETPAEATGHRYSERHFGSYQRTIKLPCPVDPDKVEAAHKNGVVTITLEKAETVRPRRIQVRST